MDSDSICPRVFEVLVDRILQVEPQQSHRSLFTLIGASGGLARLGLEPYRQIKIHAVSLHAALLCHLPTFHTPHALLTLVVTDLSLTKGARHRS